MVSGSGRLTGSAFVTNLHRSGQDFQSQTQPLCINGEHLTRTDAFQYLGVSITSNLTWTDHILKLSYNVRRLSLTVKRLKSLGTPTSSILTFVKACILHHFTYCSPVIFPGLLSKDFLVLKRSIRLLSKCSNISYNSIVDLIVDLHFRSCDTLSRRILSDDSHPLHSVLSNHTSKRNTRQSFTHMVTRTSTLKNSCVPYLYRYLTNPVKIVKELVSTFS